MEQADFPLETRGNKISIKEKGKFIKFQLIPRKRFMGQVAIGSWLGLSLFFSLGVETGENILLDLFAMTLVIAGIVLILSIISYFSEKRNEEKEGLVLNRMSGEIQMRGNKIQQSADLKAVIMRYTDRFSSRIKSIVVYHRKGEVELQTHELMPAILYELSNWTTFSIEEKRTSEIPQDILFDHNHRDLIVKSEDGIVHIREKINYASFIHKNLSGWIGLMIFMAVVTIPILWITFKFHSPTQGELNLIIGVLMLMVAGITYVLAPHPARRPVSLSIDPIMRNIHLYGRIVKISRQAKIQTLSFMFGEKKFIDAWIKDQDTITYLPFLQSVENMERMIKRLIDKLKLEDF